MSNALAKGGLMQLRNAWHQSTDHLFMNTLKSIETDY